jgi:DNA-binding GntR family transcriptional regulator
MLEKNLAETYGVSRDTARKARRAVLSDFGEN